MTRASVASTLADFGRDVRVALRSLSRDRTFSVTALLTLIVCLGANAAIFGIVRSVVLKPLPFESPEQLVILSNTYPKAGYSAVGPGMSGAGVPDYLDRLRETTVFSSQALYTRRSLTLGLETGAQRIPAIAVTPSFFTMLGARAHRGRLFLDEDSEIGQSAKVVLAYGFWQRQFGGDASIVGRDVRIGGEPHRVVGIAEPDFRYLWRDVDLWLPLAFTAEQRSLEGRHSNNWTMLARLKPTATLDQAQREIDGLNARNNERLPQFAKILADAGFRTIVSRLQDDLVRDIRPTLYLLWGGVLLVLLVGGVNLANLTLVRASGRARELATRHALGAEMSRLARQLLTETTLLTVIGGALGLVAGWWLLRSMTALHLEMLPRGDDIGLDWQTAGLVLALSIVVGLLAGFMPVAQLPRANIGSLLREGGRAGSASGAAGRVRRILATTQVALAFVLLIGAGLLLASFRAVLRIDAGFRPEGVTTASITLPGSRYGSDDARAATAARILERVRALPGVTSAGISTTIPFDDTNNSSVIFAEGHVIKPGESFVSPDYVSVTDGWFEAMGVRLARGRFFDQRDTPSSPPVVIVDERLAAHFWPNEDPIGRRMYTATSNRDLSAITPQTRFLTVVGVIRNVSLKELTPRTQQVGAYYYPYGQSTSSSISVAVRTTGDAEAIGTAVRNAITAVDRELPVFGVATMESRLDRALVPRRVPMLIGIAFGVVGLFLAAIGIYGVLAYQVSQRRREIGIRMALGSSAATILNLVIRDGLRITGLGLAVGVVGMLALTRVMGGLLYGVRPLDPIVIALVAVVLTTVSIVATLVPARRAARVSPMAALND
ncbi:MAG TPA: ABC transporter permease [Gemmatimonadaceae bacterium]|nr:ABC transporter permease [Gemmatimonadaceae bacterium]